MWTLLTIAMLAGTLQTAEPSCEQVAEWVEHFALINPLEWEPHHMMLERRVMASNLSGRLKAKTNNEIWKARIWLLEVKPDLPTAYNIYLRKCAV